MKVLHLISGLDQGGAPVMMERLAYATASELESEVVSLTDIGPVGRRLERTGVAVHALGMPRGFPDPRGLWRLRGLLRRRRPDAVQSWLYHADLMAALARPGGGPPLAWGLHHACLERGLTGASALWAARVCAALSSRAPELIVCCSEASRRTHEGAGYCARKMEVIPNGVDAARLHPDPEGGRRIRQELNCAADAPLIGLLSRFHPIKDHGTFVAAAGLLAEREPRAVFVLAGEGVTPENQTLNAWIAAAGIQERVRLLGLRQDIPQLLAALDIATLCSTSEAFPVAVVEAMACGTPSVATDVGDCALMLNDPRRITPPGDPRALADAWLALLRMPNAERRRLGEADRERAMRLYGLDSVARRYRAVWERIVEAKRARRGSEKGVACAG